MVSPHPFARSGRNPQRTSPGERLGFSSGTPPLAGPAAWTKSPEPVFQRTEKTFGVGHNSFVTSPDGREDGLVDHAKIAVAPGWQRTLRRQPFTWRADGTPNFGPPVAAGLALPAPSGQPDRTRPNTSFAEDVRSGLGAWDGFAHPHYVRSAPGELRLGHPERDLVNAFRSGEKIVLRDRTWSARGPHVVRRPLRRPPPRHARRPTRRPPQAPRRVCVGRKAAIPRRPRPGYPHRSWLPEDGGKSGGSLRNGLP